MSLTFDYRRRYKLLLKLSIHAYDIDNRCLDEIGSQGYLQQLNEEWELNYSLGGPYEQKSQENSVKDITKTNKKNKTSIEYEQGVRLFYVFFLWLKFPRFHSLDIFLYLAIVKVTTYQTIHNEIRGC